MEAFRRIEVTLFNFHEHPTSTINVLEFLSANFQVVRMTNQRLWEQNCCERRQAWGEYAGPDLYQDECEEER
jgi:hypothetical protein